MSKVITSQAKIDLSDYQDVTWTGRSKSGEPIIITIKNAINLDNIDFGLQDKGEVVPKVTFTGTYTEDNRNEGDTPWSITRENSASDSSEILLGYGVFSIGNIDVGLTRGGGSFKVERTARDIEADGDRGPVKGRQTIDKEIPKLEMNLLEILDKLPNIYPGLTETTQS